MNNYPLKKEDKVIDNSVYTIGKDTSGNVMTTKELHEVILSLIVEFDRVCRKNNIPYALGFGSALGTYNYQDFIPWDDDADIVINYEDIPHIVESFKKDINDEFVLECYESNHKYNVLIPTFKLRKKNSYIKEKSHLTLPNRLGCDGFFLDIVAFMGVPTSPKEHYRLIKHTKRLMPLYVFLDGILRIRPSGLQKHIKNYERKVYEQYKDSPYVSQTVIIPWQDWSDEVSKLAFPKDVIYPFKEYSFGEHKFYSFNNLEEFCRLRYGERSLRKYIDGKWTDPYPNERKHPNHLTKFNLYNKK